MGHSLLDGEGWSFFKPPTDLLFSYQCLQHLRTFAGDIMYHNTSIYLSLSFRFLIFSVPVIFVATDTSILLHHNRQELHWRRSRLRATKNAAMICNRRSNGMFLSLAGVRAGRREKSNAGCILAETKKNAKYYAKNKKEQRLIAHHQASARSCVA